MIPPAGHHGGDGLAVARALGIDPATVVDLSMSLNPFAPDVAAIAARHTDAVRWYPDVTAATASLAEALGVERERVALTNGGSEAIALVARAVGGTVAGEPEFSLHPRGPSGPIWRSNPHNPTGSLAADDDRVDVWDEAFYPLAAGAWTRGDPDTVVVGSLTKLFACPGLRLGYVLADDVPRYTDGQPAWPLNGIALAVLPELLVSADLVGWREAIAARRAELVLLLTEHGFTVAAGDAPWVLVVAPGLRERLAPLAVVVRDCASFGLDGWVRIAVPDDAGMRRLADALDRVAVPQRGPGDTR
ncbi:MAG: aminotransferase class I/II-fold pyridoxal phosphate-dependent enzyme [Acidimicrobiales bacterium]